MRREYLDAVNQSRAEVDLLRKKGLSQVEYEKAVDEVSDKYRPQLDALEKKLSIAEADAAVSGKLLPDAVAQARNALPPVPEGHTRMWRVEGKSAVEAGGAGGKAGSNWFEENLGAYATASTKPGDVKYVDVPTSRVAQLKSDPNATEVQLPEGYVAQAEFLVTSTKSAPTAMVHGKAYKVGDTVESGPNKGAKVLSIDDGIPTLSKVPSKGLVGKSYGDRAKGR